MQSFLGESLLSVMLLIRCTWRNQRGICQRMSHSSCRDSVFAATHVGLKPEIDFKQPWHCDIFMHLHFRQQGHVYWGACPKCDYVTCTAAVHTDSKAAPINRYNITCCQMNNIAIQYNGNNMYIGSYIITCVSIVWLEVSWNLVRDSHSRMDHPVLEFQDGAPHSRTECCSKTGSDIYI
jgi:hypothetical protein